MEVNLPCFPAQREPRRVTPLRASEKNTGSAGRGSHSGRRTTATEAICRSDPVWVMWSHRAAALWSPTRRRFNGSWRCGYADVQPETPRVWATSSRCFDRQGDLFSWSVRGEGEMEPNSHEKRNDGHDSGRLGTLKNPQNSRVKIHLEILRSIHKKDLKLSGTIFILFSILDAWTHSRPPPPPTSRLLLPLSLNVLPQIALNPSSFHPD